MHQDIKKETQVAPQSNSNDSNAVVQSQANILSNPTEVVEMGRKMANTLKGVISQANLITKIGGGEHIQFEGWQTLGAFFQVTPKTDRVETLKNEDGKPFAVRASVNLVDQVGNIVGGAEAICSKAERNWQNKDWFQLESMAQTRAAAKALRMKFSWIVVLAGYSPTPAEEMIFESRPAPISQQPQAPAPAGEWGNCPQCNVGQIKFIKQGEKNGKSWKMWGCSEWSPQGGCDYRTFDEPVQDAQEQQMPIIDANAQ